MNTGLAPAAPALPAARQFSFADESCFDRDEQFRQVRPPVHVRQFSVEVQACYGVYYGDDDYLLEVLEGAAPHVPWRGGMVFHRWADQSRIQCLDCDTGKLVAQLEVRRYEGKKVRPEAVEAGEYGANVLTMAQLRHLRAERARAAEAAELAAAESEEDA